MHVWALRVPTLAGKATFRGVGGTAVPVTFIPDIGAIGTSWNPAYATAIVHSTNLLQISV